MEKQTRPLERAAGTSSLIEVLDRVLDKGIVIDAWVRVSLVGIELVTVEARVVVASIKTYLGYPDTLAEVKPPSAPPSQPTIVPAAPIFGVNGHQPTKGPRDDLRGPLSHLANLN